MEFKIDTNKNYTVLTPQNRLFDEKMAEAITQKWEALEAEGHKNLIIDLSVCEGVSEHIMDTIVAMHETFYNDNHSLVFTELQPQLRNSLASHEYFHAINIAPTMIEAIDIVSMENLERELLEGEE